MARSVKPALLFIFYCLNFAIITCLLTAAFFLAQGLFGDLYACNAKAKGEIQFMYPRDLWTSENFCIVDLNYTANEHTVSEQSYYAIQVALRCDRIHPDEALHKNVTTLCYNHFHPEFFASSTDPEILDAQVSHDEAVDYLHLGFKSALWMAFFAFVSSAINRNLERLDSCSMQLQDQFCTMGQFCRAKLMGCRTRLRRRQLEQNIQEQAELRQISIDHPPSASVDCPAGQNPETV